MKTSPSPLSCLCVTQWHTSYTHAPCQVMPHVVCCLVCNVSLSCDVCHINMCLCVYSRSEASTRVMPDMCHMNMYRQQVFKTRASPQVALQCFIVWLLYFYCSMALRENVLMVNGSNIRPWWIRHHYWSIFTCFLFLTIPIDSPGMVSPAVDDLMKRKGCAMKNTTVLAKYIRRQLMWTALQSVVMLLQNRCKPCVGQCLLTCRVAACCHLQPCTSLLLTITRDKCHVHLHHSTFQAHTCILLTSAPLYIQAHIPLTLHLNPLSTHLRPGTSGAACTHASPSAKTPRWTSWAGRVPEAAGSCWCCTHCFLVCNRCR